MLYDGSSGVVTHIADRNAVFGAVVQVNVIGAGGSYADHLQGLKPFHDAGIKNHLIGDDDFGVEAAVQYLIRFGHFMTGQFWQCPLQPIPA